LTIVIFDGAVALAPYDLLRSAGLSAETAVLLAGVFPAAGVAIGVIRHRRLDVVGALVGRSPTARTRRGRMNGWPPRQRKQVLGKPSELARDQRLVLRHRDLARRAGQHTPRVRRQVG